MGSLSLFDLSAHRSSPIWSVSNLMSVYSIFFRWSLHTFCAPYVLRCDCFFSCPLSCGHGVTPRDPCSRQQNGPRTEQFATYVSSAVQLSMYNSTRGVRLFSSGHRIGLGRYSAQSSESFDDTHIFINLLLKRILNSLPFPALWLSMDPSPLFHLPQGILPLALDGKWVHLPHFFPTTGVHFDDEQQTGCQQPLLPCVAHHWNLMPASCSEKGRRVIPFQRLLFLVSIHFLVWSGRSDLSFIWRNSQEHQARSFIFSLTQFNVTLAGRGNPHSNADANRIVLCAGR